jgi:hypothetical protein
MGVLSSLNKERKRATKKVQKSAESFLNNPLDYVEEKVEKQLKFGQKVWENTSIVGAGRKEIRKQRASAKTAARAARQLQATQERSAALAGAELSNEIAMRSRLSRKGGKRSMLSMGETGSLMV